jgi:hypothetical protein
MAGRQRLPDQRIRLTMGPEYRCTGNSVRRRHYRRSIGRLPCARYREHGSKYLCRDMLRTGRFWCCPGCLSAEFTNLGNLGKVSRGCCWKRPNEIAAALVARVGLQPPPPQRSELMPSRLASVQLKVPSQDCSHQHSKQSRSRPRQRSLRKQAR